MAYKLRTGTRTVTVRTQQVGAPFTQTNDVHVFENVDTGQMFACMEIVQAQLGPDERIVETTSYPTDLGPDFQPYIH